ncbi:hypothetical protein AJ79_06419 [Helicocarpus griseus UAMH5409]|uniref:Uncharacterized protein n=1 Tax=Helicocarpus griseus UAMH5409 TaxID=1447875 RepID=A0A2B7XDC3_9EURO|nr:hypothetical protein AJ79_06419 [Helicocarpus griseus UAMH5409]
MATPESPEQHTQSPSPSPTISTLKTNQPFWYKLHVLIHDLRNYTTDPTVLSLDATGETLEQTIAQTLEERLNRRMKKRVGSGDYRVCAAHDLAPVPERAFGIDYKRLGRDERVLELKGEVWEGLEGKGGRGRRRRGGRGDE